MISKKTNNFALLAEINRSISTLSNHGALARVMKKWQQISVAKSQESQQKATPTDSSSGVMNITEQGLIAALNASKRYSAE